MRNSITLILILIGLVGYSQTSTENYVRTITARYATGDDLTTKNWADSTMQQVQYVDGLGRLKQSVVRWGSPDKKDIVTPMVYDPYGRQAINYLPYEHDHSSSDFVLIDTAIARQHDYYTYRFGGNDGDHAYAETGFEPSPLDRVLEQASPGYAWRMGSGKTVTTSYEFNTSQDEVKLYLYGDLQVSAQSHYPAGELTKVITKDEDNHETITFTDKLGQTILKRSYTGTEWAETYYIYDAWQRLKVVIPPQAQKAIVDYYEGLVVDGFAVYGSPQTTSASLSDTAMAYTFEASLNFSAPTSGIAVLSDLHAKPIEVLTPDFLAIWAFQYDYDDRNRMISKQVPGAEPVYMVYDQWDRLVLTQDGELRKNNEWLFTKYDAINRPVMTGIKVITGSLSTVRSAVATEADRYESQTGTLKGYTNVTYPSATEPELLTVTYYDDYAFVSGSDLSGTTYQQVYTTADVFHIATPATLYDQVKGQVTGTLTRGEGTDFITTITYYDEKYRPVQVVAENHLTNGKDIVSNQYDFVGNIRKTQTEHFDGSTTTTIKRRFEYDHMDRLTHTWHEVNSEGEVLISRSTYNEIGELERKDLHYEGASADPAESAFEQNLDYEYNIRGWLRAVNDPGGLGADLFGMKLHYNDNPLSASANDDHFNGNISAMEWSNYDVTNTGIAVRGYSFAYDDLNRLKSADHFEDGTGESRYGVSGLNYDLNGNMLALTRNGADGSAIDNLDFHESEYIGNQLMKVTDSSNDATGFDNGNSGSGTDYTYDDNGNMISDANKGITSIEYNHLNLPVTVILSSVEGDSITYLYDAAGIKLRQSVYKADTLFKSTDYVGEFIYEDSVLNLIQHEEGRVVPVIASGSAAISDWDYQYHLKDHLGNVRVTFSTEAENYEMDATMEDSNEQTMFSNYAATADGAIANSGTHVFRNSNTSNGGLGMNTFLGVNKGDTIKASAYAYYSDAGGSYNLAAGLIEGFLFGSFGTNYGVEGATVTQTNFDDAFISGTALGDRSTSSSAPLAYINYIVFDKDMNYVTAAFKQIESASNGAMALVAADDYVADREGYIMVYLSNETQGAEVMVSWDDLQVYHGKTNVVSTQDYYPFGLTFNESVRTASTLQKYKFGGKEEQTDWGIGVMDFEARFYDGAIGRFMNSDPLADAMGQVSWNPYHYTYNNPVAFVDPSGMLAWRYEGGIVGTSLDGEDEEEGDDTDGEDDKEKGNTTNVSITPITNPQNDANDFGQGMMDGASEGMVGGNLVGGGKLMLIDEENGVIFIADASEVEIADDGSVSINLNKSAYQLGRETGNLFGNALLALSFADAGISMLGGARPIASMTDDQWMQVGRWMCSKEASNMKTSGLIQLSAGNQTHILTKGSWGFEKEATKGSVYAEFNLAGNALVRTSNAQKGWAIVSGPGSIGARAAAKKGVTNITIPKVANVKIIRIK